MTVKQPRRDHNPYEQKDPDPTGHQVVVVQDLIERSAGEHQPHEELERESEDQPAKADS